jgi:hypothetical protein
VYRRANTRQVRDLLAPLPNNAEVRLWALDESDPALERHTVGAGPGGRWQHLGVLIDALPADIDPLVIVDDDVRFVVGDLVHLVRAGRAAALDVYQPAHSSASKTSFLFVRKQLLSFARRSLFVEQGPVLALSARARDVLLPPPDHEGMGWGIEARWSELAVAHDLSLGIVDAVTIRHLGPPGESYDMEAELARLRVELAARGLDDLRDLHVELERIGLLDAWRMTKRR